MLALADEMAFGQVNIPFNHASTGFVLDGVHLRLPCESCHKTGVPGRGLPRDCVNCHIQGGVRASTFQLQNHIPNFPGQTCQDCHTQNSWTPALMRHSTVMQSQCIRCHNGVLASGRPTNPRHPTTTASCDACHTTGAFLPIKTMVHDASTAGRCSTCHNGTMALGKAPFHVPTNAQCDTCHTSTVTFLDAKYVHETTSWGRCTQCHNGQTAKGQPPTHVPTSGTQCDSCHQNQITFTALSMNHSALTPVATGRCSDCHGGNYVSQNAQAKPTTHVPTSLQCDSSGCHSSTTTWGGVAYAHNDPAKTYTANCASCHYPGGPGLSKPTPHVPTTRQCDGCHTMVPSSLYNSFRPAKMDHTGTAGQCVTCHSGTYKFANAQAQAVTHIKTTRACDSCHLNFVAFSPATMDHSGLNGQCSTCHSGAYLSENAQQKPTTHLPTTAQCDTCHTSTVTWATAAFAHDATATGNCSSCHKPGGPGLSKPTNHVPTALQCDTCHTNFAAFKPAFMNHAGTAAQCSTCHNGAYVFARADQQGVTHVPDKRQCDVCHTSTVVWTAMTFVHPANAAGTCSNCHSGQYLTENAQMKPTTHLVTTAQCDTCHSNFNSWATGAAPNHTTYVANCRNCHIPGATPGPQGLTPPTTHIPAGTVQCDQCHNKYPALFKPAKMDHTQVASTACSTCHSGTYYAQNALPQGATHIPTGAQCNVCHTSAGVSWTLRVMQHSAVTATACSTCHSGAYLTENALAKGANHIPIGATTCDKCHTPPASGNTPGFSPATMDHSQVVAATACATCHGGAYLSENAQTKPASGHVATTLACNSSGCHTSTSYTSWVTTSYAHNQPSDSTNCGVTCHVSAATSTTTGIPKSVPHVPVPAGITTCGTCHGQGVMPPSYATFSQRPYMNHTGVVTGQCNTCHNPTYAYTNANPQGTTHIPETRQCDTCHTSTTDWTTRSFVHPANAAGTCSNCHSGQYLTENAQTKPPTHLATTAQCDGCHSGFTSWATSAAPTHTLYLHNCTSCHVPGASPGPQGLTKPSTHIPVALSVQCDYCHNKYPGLFKPAKMDHTQVVGTTACATCHNGAYAAVNALPQGATHIPTGSTACNVCHGNTGYVSWTLRLMQHSAVAATSCNTCHSGAYLTENALARSVNHIPVGTVTCDKCHTPPASGNTPGFSPAKMDHTQVVAATPCATCHGGAYLSANAQTKPATGHVPTALACNNSGCHTSTTYASWAMTTYAHNQAGDSTKCGSSCHVTAGTGTGLIKPTPHVPMPPGVTVCGTCHSTFPPVVPGGFSQRPFMNHTAAAVGQCNSCHNATYAYTNANPQGASHIPTTAQCDGCHTSTVNWTTRSMNHALVVGANACATCHGGAYISENALAKGSNHIPTGTLACNQCHTATTYVNWTDLPRMDHTKVTATPCSTCHGGSYLSENAQAKGANHVPETRECNVCHTSTTVWTQRTYVHPTNAAGNCKTCHSGAYVSENALGPPANHIPYATSLLGGATMSCDASCHSGYVSWAPGKTNHNGTQGNGVGGGFCKTCHQTGTSYLGTATKMQMTHKSGGKTDCSVSGCHKPLGSTGTPYTKWK